MASTRDAPARITDPPDVDQTVEHDGKPYRTIKEGLAYILVPKVDQNATREKGRFIVEEKQSIFYNPIQQFNRDLTVLAIKAHGKQIIEKKIERRAKPMGRKRKRNENGESNRAEKVSKLVPENGAQIAALDEADVAASVPGPVPEAQGASTAAHETDIVVEAANGEAANGPENGAAEGDSSAVQQAGNPRGDDLRGEQKPVPYTILDALSATGLRALRYAHELPFVTSVTANDIDAEAVESIKRNAKHNGLEDKIRATQDDALGHMYTLLAEDLKHKDRASQKYDVIDLDPYGTSAPFFDTAVQAVRSDDGLLCVTCTDSGVFASSGYPEKAFALYGGTTSKGPHAHEVGLRLIINAIATSAARHGLAIEPLLSLSIDFYVRVFIKVRRSPASVKFQAARTMIVYSCDEGCGSWTTQLLGRNKRAPNKNGTGFFYKHGFAAGPTTNQFCEHCGSKMHLAGPMYAGPIHSAEFVERVLAEVAEAPKDVYMTTERLEGMLYTALEELQVIPPLDEGHTEEDRLHAIDPYPFFVMTTALAKAVHCEVPSEDCFGGALQHLGYVVTRSHCKPGSIKTNAPWSVIWHVMREWVRQKAPVREDRLSVTTRAARILNGGRKPEASAESDKKEGEASEASDAKDGVEKLEVAFDKKLKRVASKPDLVRYQVNPAENWGPMVRAKGK